VPYLHDHDIEMSYKPLITKKIENTDVLFFLCGCLSVWDGEKWIPEHERPPFLETEVPCTHWVE